MRYKITPIIMKRKVEEYFTQCAEQKVFPDLAGLRVYCSIRKDDLSMLLDPEQEPKAEEFQDIMAYFSDRCESLLTRKMVSDPKAATGCKYALSMPEYGGWSDHSKEKTDRKINIKVSKEDEELFK